MKNKEIIVIFVAIAIIAIAGIFISNSKKDAAITAVEDQKESATTETTKGATTQTSQTATKVSTPKIGPSAIVYYTDEGFSTSEFLPSIVNIHRGQTVRFVNKTKSEKMWVASDEHPKHNILPGFDQKTSVGQGGAYEYTFTEMGKWRYHNHVNPVRKGMIIVKE